MTDICMQCGRPKEDNEFIQCPDCQEYFEIMQQEMLQKQLDEIKKGMPTDEIRILRETEEITTKYINRFHNRTDMIAEMRLAEHFLIAVSRKRVLAEIEAETLQ